MTTALRPAIDCPAPTLTPGAQGIERVAVDDAQAQLTVTFVRAIAPGELSVLLQRGSYTLTGGARIFPRILSAALPAVPDPLHRTIVLTLDVIGDFSVYTLSVSAPEIDPFFADVALRFRLACDDAFDCRAPVAAPAAPPEIAVSIDYLGKDYASFRQALLDFVAVRFPSWTERSEADIGMMLLELFAATADTLSIMQDRVANEAFLGSATQRRSVAGHLALVGYRLDEGASAWTFLQLAVNAPASLNDNVFLTVTNDPQSAGEPVIVFETLGNASLDPRHQTMPLYDWGNAGCCVDHDVFTAALAGSYDGLAAGDWLLFDDGRAPSVVRLSATPQITAAPAVGSPPFSPPFSPPLSPPGGMLTLVQWSAATPLGHDFCVRDTVVRGNVVLATHGETVEGEALRALTPAQKTALAKEIAARGPGERVPRQRLTLANAPLARLDPSTLALANGTQRTTSTISLEVGEPPVRFTELPTLLESASDATVFRVEIDDAGDATVVFGDGTFGVAPDETADVFASYRVGGGAIGNVAAATLTRAPLHPPWLDAVTNPLAASGGRDRESSDHARRLGPATFLDPLVAVTAADYRAAAEAFTDANGAHRVQRAKAAFRWTGSWLTVTLAVEPAGADFVDAALRAALLAYLETRRLAGYDLDLADPVYVPLELEVSLCIAPGFAPGDVQQRVVQALHDFFAPANFSFGDRLYVSRLYAALAAVSGVDAATIVRLSRLHAANPAARTAQNLRQGYLDVGPAEVIRLDDDRNRPEHGTARVDVVGTGT
ncbi:MAG: baseplate J/gp47 family protein [Candidatus Eremiobacteraeota bacterium]|nr:baseplate J/gp47 family protein [Candidatus Eremiobacteraeota bacterium]